MLLQKARNFVPVFKYIAPLLTFFLLFVLWVYGRAQDAVFALFMGALLSALSMTLFVTGRRRFFKNFVSKGELSRLAESGRLYLRLKDNSEALLLLLQALENDYKIEEKERRGEYVIGNYGGEKVLFALSDGFDGASSAKAVVDLYRRCAGAGIDRGALFLLGEGRAVADSLARKLPLPRVGVIGGDVLDSYFAQIARQADFEPEKSGRSFSAVVCTAKNGVRCMISAAYMIAAYILLGLHWLLFPALLLAAFASVCRYLDRDAARLF